MFPRVGQSYEESDYDEEVVKLMRSYKLKGFKISIYTARTLHIFNGDLGKINAITLPKNA